MIRIFSMIAFIVAVATIVSTDAQAKCADPVVNYNDCNTEPWNMWAVDVWTDSNCDGSLDTRTTVMCDGSVITGPLNGSVIFLGSIPYPPSAWAVGVFTYQVTADPDTQPFPWQLTIISSGSSGDVLGTISYDGNTRGDVAMDFPNGLQ